MRASTSPFIHFALAAAQEALTQAGWVSAQLSDEQRERTGVAIGSGIGSVEESYEAGHTLHTEGVRRASPHGIPRLLINLAAGQVSIAHGFRGPNHAVSTACATGANAIGTPAPSTSPQPLTQRLDMCVGVCVCVCVCVCVRACVRAMVVAQAMLRA
jgi:3-oxoacyl-(acyl-carrier-protein) synthase